MVRFGFKESTAWLLLLLPVAVATDLASFDDFVKAYDKVYASVEEKQIRKGIFESNLQAIASHNLEAPEGHILEINEFADLRIPEELPLGLHKKSREIFSSEFLMLKQPSEADELYQNFLDGCVPVHELPKEVDWRTKTPKVTTEVKDQGMCGSCWAVAATAVLESHIALQTGKLFTLSPQELVSCVANPEHCGGGGGCEGATYELAFEHVMKHGMVPESEFPYKSGGGAVEKCTLENATFADYFSLRGTPSGPNEDSEYIDGAVATIQGYINFPQNNYTALMNAVATLGPIGVTVAASQWAFYKRGIFELKDHNSTAATTVNHAVVLEGYGVDQETQEEFWLVRNSWGAGWGEGGYIRLKRVDPSTLPDFDADDCGIDTDPSDGAACTRDKDGNPIVPKPIKVCGTTAILYDTFVPVGGRLLSNGMDQPVLEQ